MSYTLLQITGNNANSRDQTDLHEELAALRGNIVKTKDSLAEMLAKAKYLEKQIVDHRRANNRIARDAGLEAPAPTGKATKGVWERVRASIEPPFCFEAIPGNADDYDYNRVNEKYDEIGLDTLPSTVPAPTAPSTTTQMPSPIPNQFVPNHNSTQIASPFQTLTDATRYNALPQSALNVPVPTFDQYSSYPFPTQYYSYPSYPSYSSY